VTAIEWRGRSGQCAVKIGLIGRLMTLYGEQYQLDTKRTGKNMGTSGFGSV
jgi:hypothetical protein